MTITFNDVDVETAIRIINAVARLQEGDRLEKDATEADNDY